MANASVAGRKRYVVGRTLGRGGMATVFLARDETLGRPVALKVLADNLAGDEVFRARFLREARLAARVVHPNVVQVYDAGADESSLYIAMEYVDGESLADELRRRGPLPADDVVALGLQLAAALDACHSAGLVHRDVKPANVLRAQEGAVKLGDFGIARSQDATALTEHGSVLGTAAYLSPEQARGDPVTAAADLYALGVLLYEALTGRRPHEGTSLAELVLSRERDAVAPPSALVEGVPAMLESAILSCLASRPEERPASAAALAAQLAATYDPTAETRILAAPRSRRRRLVLLLAGLAALAAGIAFAAIATTRPGHPPQTTPATVQAKTPPATTPKQVVRRTPPPAAVQHPVVARAHAPKVAHKHKPKHAHKPKPAKKHGHGPKGKHGK